MTITVHNTKQSPCMNVQNDMINAQNYESMNFLAILYITSFNLIIKTSYKNISNSLSILSLHSQHKELETNHDFHYLYELQIVISIKSGLSTSLRLASLLMTCYFKNIILRHWNNSDRHITLFQTDSVQ